QTETQNVKGVTRLVGAEGHCIAVCGKREFWCIKSAQRHQITTAIHSPSCMTSLAEAANCISCRFTSSNCESRIPDNTNRPHVAPSSVGNKSMMTGAVRFAQTKSAEGISSETLP